LAQKYGAAAVVIGRAPGFDDDDASPSFGNDTSCSTDEEDEDRDLIDLVEIPIVRVGYTDGQSIVARSREATLGDGDVRSNDGADANNGEFLKCSLTIETRAVR